MTKQEFEQRIGTDISTLDYCIVEKVYTYHPIISNENGKDEISEIYKLGGMRIIKDMLPTAEEAESLYMELEYCKARYEEAKEEYDNYMN